MYTHIGGMVIIHESGIHKFDLDSQYGMIVV